MAAIVSGGTKGIGRAICDIFLEKGMDLSLCSRNLDDLKAFHSECSHKYPSQKIHISKVDMSVKEDVYRYASEIKSEFDEIGVLVNNAGTFIPGIIIKEEDGLLEKLMNTNLYSAYYLTRALIDRMIDRKTGHIFNICSVASLIAYPSGGSYGISKFALLGFSKSIREELKEYGIKVTSIIPGATWTDSWAGAGLPVERFMDAHDVAKMVWSAYDLGNSVVVEDIILRPQLGDL